MNEKELKKKLNDINKLLLQLSKNAKLLNIAGLKEILKRTDSENLYFLTVLIKKTGQIIGMACLTLIRIPTGLIARIEDVVVDKKYRGKGVGKMMTKELIKIAKKRGVKHIDLTSSPKREAANKMYKRLGFIKRDTNIFRLII